MAIITTTNNAAIQIFALCSSWSCLCLGLGTLALVFFSFYKRRRLLNRQQEQEERQEYRHHQKAMKDPPTVSDLVLIGGGHSHVHVIKMLGMPPRREILRQHGVRVTLVAKDIHTPYSGMLPGFVSGHYTYDDIHIDLARLCRFSGIRLIHAAADRITYNDQNGSGGGLVHCSDGRPPVRYDCLSVDIGSAPAAGDDVCSAAPGQVIPVKPIANFCKYYEGLKNRWQQPRSQVGSSGNNNSHEKQTQEEQHNHWGGAPPPKKTPYTIGVVGGGAGGIELVLSIQYSLLQQQAIFSDGSTAAMHDRQQEQEQSQILKTTAPPPLSIFLVTRGKTLMQGHNSRVQAKFRRILKERNIQVYYQAEVIGVEPVDGDDNHDDERGGGDNLDGITNNGSHPKKARRRMKLILSESSRKNNPNPIVFDDCIWCITAGVSSWLSENTPFSNDQGFLIVRDTYECIHHPGVFAAGDCCHMEEHPRPKAGVFAVRAGPYLCDNVLNYLQGRVLRRHRPQKEFLGLISTGDKHVVASKGNWLCMEGGWLWTWKDKIDRRFMDKFSNLPSMDEMRRTKSSSFRQSSQQTTTSDLIRSKGRDVLDAFTKNPMRCGGCGAKVGSTTLSRVLNQVYQRQKSRAVSLGLNPPTPINHDDAAVVPLPNKDNTGGRAAIVQTIDYFREMITDPFIFGKIVAVHALSDVHAMGATAKNALSLAVVPFAADESITEMTLLQLLSGVSDILQDEGVQMIGGHTCEGTELSCGLSIQGYTDDWHSLLRKRGGRIKDKIVLTKPIGTGALFAADMQAQCKGEYVIEAIRSMIKSNGPASQVAMNFDGVHACTDVTGFGLVGHLLEMLIANDDDGALDTIGSTLSIPDIPFLLGGMEASSLGIFSTLQPQNIRNRRAVSNHLEAAKRFPVEYPLLFDPQTAGGLLFFVDPDKCDEFVSQLQMKKVSAHVIGELIPFNTEKRHANNTGESFGVCTIGGGGESSTSQRIQILF